MARTGPWGWCGHSERFRIAAGIDKLFAGADAACSWMCGQLGIPRRADLEAAFALGRSATADT